MFEIGKWTTDLNGVGIVYALTALVCLLMIVLILRRVIRTTLQDRIDVNFVVTLGVFISFTVFDVLWGLGYSKIVFFTDEVSRILMNISSYAYYILSSLCAFTWFGYIISFMGMKGKTKIIFNVLRIGLVVLQVAIVIPLFFSAPFEITPALEYIKSENRTLCYLLVFMYYVFIVCSGINGMIIHRKNPEERVKSRKVLTYSGILLGFSVLAWLFFDAAFYSIGLMVVSFVIYAYRITENREQYFTSLYKKTKRDATHDVLTALRNKRSFDENAPKTEVTENFVAISFDVDSLKMINDKYGHEAGDEVIVAASQCILNAFGKYGHVYRVGGDEFITLVNASKEDLQRAKDEFNVYINEWRGEHIDSFHISVGEASIADYPGTPVEELVKISDKKMYDNKNEYYSKVGFERRDLQKAYISLIGIYEHVLRVNLATDEFKIMGVGEAADGKKNKTVSTFTEWIKQFVESNGISSKDKSHFIDEMNCTFFKEYFKKASNYQYSCVRKIGDAKYKAVFLAVPNNNKKEEIYFFVRNIESINK